MNFIDASIIVKAFTINDEQEYCLNALRGEFITDALCLIESGNAIAAIKKDRQFSSNCIKSLFKGRGTIIPVERNLLFEAIKRQSSSELSLFDLIHYTTAVLYACKAILSYDKNFDNQNIKRAIP
ncbi:PIN domain-containing protein [Candidatus Woesearchaeota archaeon]|nr:PIN domain-containing protein [Candidatus Woesearchaeota archaeon]